MKKELHSATIDRVYDLWVVMLGVILCGGLGTVAGLMLATLVPAVGDPWLPMLVGAVAGCAWLWRKIYA